MARSSMTIGTSRTGELVRDAESQLIVRIDEDRARKAREEMIKKKVIYGHSVPYRNMCRFNSGVSWTEQRPWPCG